MSETEVREDGLALLRPAEPPEVAPEELCRVILFRACDEWFGLPIQYVREVQRLERMTRVPNAPAEILGILNLRGRILTLFDPAGCLDIPAGTHPPTHTVVLDLGDPDLSVGLAVQEIGQVRGIPPSSIGSPPAREKGSGALQGVFELDGQVVGLLDLPRVFARFHGEWGLSADTREAA
jgi:purine-binding chemotaxis protein CheW